ncbi:MAG TPA: CRISPR-associated endonuclease Cas2 [Methylomusa anaerophila]|uniref:CRISPR-associated endonuclease Cas2 n=1 Tax=Methylomusa anaerophila TaxID=1930071 RepID=UPI002C1C0E82|nr:CRISPR-associated endonuclease Cas2 [Methylomusa anaerophila]HML90462.1 CRISPR-associated endonuclease Cas2 [Methylomusa anaerophila]
MQNSVLEGEISDANYTKLTMELNKIINNEEDSVIIYNLRTTKYSTRQILGHERASTSTII